ncbi:UrcA family protein [Novosphingobium aerophilum]|uniref:UrcA family protein n=1 Tax=Novosphingobium TaxID=165696 RepID=UPI00163D9ECA|nr:MULTISPECIES: UrcA family protein [unclassified Novosphingobium]WRT92456.1 UrcA family protein [Novosphingobium sp. RL4]
MTRIHTKIVTTAMFAMASFALVTPVLADVVVKEVRNSNLPTREVRYGDLDLTTASGQDSLTRRLTVAVRQVCGGADMRDLPAYSDMMRCRDDSSERAFTQRDALFAERIAARGQPDRIATNTRAISIVAVRSH